MGKRNTVEGYRFDSQDRLDWLDTSRKEADREKVNRRRARKAKMIQRNFDAEYLGE